MNLDIKVYQNDSEEKNKLLRVCELVNEDLGFQALSVQDCVFGAGQDWHWTTIAGRYDCPILTPAYQGYILTHSAIEGATLCLHIYKHYNDTTCDICHKSYGGHYYLISPTTFDMKICYECLKEVEKYVSNNKECHKNN